MALNRIYDLLARFRVLRAPKRELSRLSAEVIGEVAHVPLTPEVCTVRGSILFVTTNPIRKSEITLHKRDILRTLHTKYPETKERITDIR